MLCPRVRGCKMHTNDLKSVLSLTSVCVFFMFLLHKKLGEIEMKCEIQTNEKLKEKNGRKKRKKKRRMLCVSCVLFCLFVGRMFYNVKISMKRNDDSNIRMESNKKEKNERKKEWQCVESRVIFPDSNKIKQILNERGIKDNKKIDEMCLGPFPNEFWGSDHNALLSVFQLKN